MYQQKDIRAARHQKLEWLTNAIELLPGAKQETIAQIQDMGSISDINNSLYNYERDIDAIEAAQNAFEKRSFVYRLFHGREKKELAMWSETIKDGINIQAAKCGTITKLYKVGEFQLNAMSMYKPAPTDEPVIVIPIGAGKTLRSNIHPSQLTDRSYKLDIR